MKIRYIGQLLKAASKDWVEDKAPRLGAALAYYTVFSLAPLMLIVIAVAGFFFGQEAAQNQLVGQLRGMVGQQGAEALQSMIQNASKPSHGIVASIVGFAILLFGASGVFGQLQDSLNTIWEVKPKPGRGIWGFIKSRFLSFAMVLGIGFLLLVSLVLTAVLAAVGGMFEGVFGEMQFLFQAFNFLLSFAVITVLFAMIFKLLPDAEIAWRDVWVGAIITALLFTVGKILIGLYLGRGSATSAFGGAASLVVLLIWIYYSAQILFFGAEFTQVYAARFGSKVKPAENAVAVGDAERLNQGLSGSKPSGVATNPERDVDRGRGRNIAPSPALVQQTSLDQVKPATQITASLGLIALLAARIIKLRRRKSA